MKFTVTVTAQALESLNQAFEWLVERSPQHAPLWYNRVLDAVDSLEQFPTRCPKAPENENAAEDVRQLIVGDRNHAYRIVFAIRGSVIVILDILHGARMN